MKKVAKLQRSTMTTKMQLFASRLAKGDTQADAYRIAYDIDPEKSKAATVYSNASILAKHPKVINEVQELTRLARLEDIDDQRRALIDMLNDMDSARQAENWTAVVGFTKLRYIALGMLENKIVIRTEEQLTDKELIHQIAKGDPIIEHKLNQLMIPNNFDPPIDVEQPALESKPNGKET